MGDGIRLEAGRVRQHVPCGFDSRSFRSVALSELSN